MFGARVTLANPPFLVDDEHAILQFGDDALADQRLIAQRLASLARQLLVGDHPPGEQPSADRDGEESRREEPRLEKIDDVVAQPNLAEGVLEQHAQACQRGIEQHQPPLAHEASPGQGHQKQGTEAATPATRDVHQEGQHERVDHHVEGQLRIEMPPVTMQTNQRAGGRQQIEAGHRKMKQAALGRQQ